VETTVDTPTVLAITTGKICDNLLIYLRTSLIARQEVRQTLLFNIYGICLDVRALEGVSYWNKHSVSTIFSTSVY